jgi:hypothetical protein
MRKTKQSLNFTTVVKKCQFEDYGTRLLRGFLFQTNLNLQTKESFNHVNEMRYKVAAMYRRHLQALRGRSDAMRIVFQDQSNYLQSFYIKKKKGVTIKKHSKILARIININEEIKERVLLLFMTRMKFYYTVKTLKWFLLYRSDQYSLEEVSFFLSLTHLLDFTLDPRNDEAGAKALEATIRNGCSPF